MSAENQLDVLYKNVYGDGTIRLLPDFAKIQKRTPFTPKTKTGDYYEVPVLLGYEHGFTYAQDGAGSVTLNSAVAGNVAKARVQGSLIYLRSRLSYEDTLKAASAGPQAFESATSLVVDNMERSFAKRLELSFLYGTRGLGVVESNSSGVLTITRETFAAGLWTGMKDCILEAWDGVTGSDSQHNGDLTIASVSHTDRTITVTGTSAAVVAGDHLFFKGARTASAFKECAGLDKILTNTGTLFNISAETYELWASNQSAVAAEIAMVHVLNLVGACCDKGLDKDAVLWTNTKNWNTLNSNEAALRRYGAEITGKAKNGSRGIEYESTNGKTEIEAHPFLKNGDGMLIAAPDKRLMRVGASDITFRRPGADGVIMKEVEDATAFELRAMADQAICHQTPGQCGKLTGLVTA